MRRMRRGTGVCAAAFVAVWLTGCGGGGSSTATSEPVAAGARATTTLVASDPPPSPTNSMEPVDEADLAGSYPDGYVDLSAEAQQAFHAWVEYEVQGPSESQGPDMDVTAGVAACEWRSQHLETTRIVGLLRSEMGYDGTGAAAVLAGALRALCTQGDLGYRTTFDIDTEKFMNALTLLDLTFDTPPTVYQYGFFLKTTCQGMINPQVGGPGIYEYMVAQMQTSVPMIHAGDQHALDVFIHEAVLAGCSVMMDQLPPRIQNAS